MKFRSDLKDRFTLDKSAKRETAQPRPEGLDSHKKMIQAP